LPAGQVPLPPGFLAEFPRGVRAAALLSRLLDHMRGIRGAIKQSWPRRALSALFVIEA